MIKKHVLFMSFLLIFALVIGYFNMSYVKATTFNDQNLIFNFDNPQSDNDDLKSKVITITNETGFDLDNLTLTIGIRSHPFNPQNSERRALKTISGFKIKSNETKGVSIYLPDVNNSEKLEVDFEGNVVVNKIKKVPFQIGGALRALIAAP